MLLEIKCLHKKASVYFAKLPSQHETTAPPSVETEVKHSNASIFQ